MMAKKAVWYKITGPKGEAVNGGYGTWYLPKGKKSGEWMPKVHPYICVSGYHLVLGHGINGWGEAGRLLWVAEGAGITSGPHGSDGKMAYEQARLIRLVGVFPKGFSRYKTKGMKKSEVEVLAEIKDPKAYAAKLKREADAKKKAEVKAKAEQARKKAACLKKYGKLKAAVATANRAGANGRAIAIGWMMANGMTYKGARKFYDDNCGYLN